MSAVAPSRDREVVADDRGAGGDDHGGAPPAQGMPWGRVVAMVAAFAFLGGAIGFVVNEDRPPGTDSVDVGFYQDMIVHHGQGVDMSLIVLAGDPSPAVRAFASEIARAQSYEIGLMDAQLGDWGYPAADGDDTAMGWMGMPVPTEAMPGLATEDELDQLRQAEDAEADALFLELMAEHHRGGIDMASFAAERADDPGVRALAERMATNQGFEINEFVQAAEREGLDADIEPYRTDAARNADG